VCIYSGRLRGSRQLLSPRRSDIVLSRVSKIEYAKMATTDSSKKVLEDIIEIHKTHPCAFGQSKTKCTMIDTKKGAAYKLLIEKLREIEPFHWSCIFFFHN
jgi:hypothetical protein